MHHSQIYNIGRSPGQKNRSIARELVSLEAEHPVTRYLKYYKVVDLEVPKNTRSNGDRRTKLKGL